MTTITPTPDLSKASDAAIINLSKAGSIPAFLEGRRRGLSRKTLSFPTAA